MSAFNGDFQAEARIKHIQKTFNCPIGIETGTLRGWTTVAMATMFPKVFTIEAELTNFSISRMLLKPIKNVKMLYGNSGEILDTLLAELSPTLASNERIFLYLDAHWNEYWPLLDELRAIAKHLKHKACIVIDDVQVPGRPDIPFDSYGGHACSYEYVKPVLIEIYGGEQMYVVEYMYPDDESVLKCHAKLLITPKTI